MPEEIPDLLKTACVIGDLPLAHCLYTDLIRGRSPSSTLILSSSRSQPLARMATFAAAHSHPNILAFCFSYALEIDHTSENDPLIEAAYESRSVEIFQILLDNGMDVNRCLELGGSPLTVACYAGDVELCRFLLESGADPNSGAVLGYYEALIWAIVGRNASIPIIRLLISHGVAVKQSGALIAAAEHGKLEALKLLLEDLENVDLEELEWYGAYDSRLEDDQGTALYKAAVKGHKEIVEFLMGKGADKGFRDRRGRGLVDVAVANGHDDIARMLH